MLKDGGEFILKYSFRGPKNLNFRKTTPPLNHPTPHHHELIGMDIISFFWPIFCNSLGKFVDWPMCVPNLKTILYTPYYIIFRLSYCNCARVFWEAELSVGIAAPIMRVYFETPSFNNEQKCERCECFMTLRGSAFCYYY